MNAVCHTACTVQYIVRRESGVLVHFGHILEQLMLQILYQ